MHVIVAPACLSAIAFDQQFNELMNVLSATVMKHASLYKSSKKQKRFLQKL